MAKEFDAPPLLDPLIHSIRGQRVILDADLARLYGVTTRRFNEGFRRNRDRFPEDFAFQLTIAEFAAARFRPAPSDLQPADLQGNIQNRSQFATGSQKHRDPRFRPWVFSEHGADRPHSGLSGATFGHSAAGQDVDEPQAPGEPVAGEVAPIGGPD